jgi:tetratricopeptide (TPR) repeat protein
VTASSAIGLGAGATVALLLSMACRGSDPGEIAATPAATLSPSPAGAGTPVEQTPQGPSAPPEWLSSDCGQLEGIAGLVRFMGRLQPIGDALGEVDLIRSADRLRGYAQQLTTEAREGSAPALALRAMLASQLASHVSSEEARGRWANVLSEDMRALHQSDRPLHELVDTYLRGVAAFAGGKTADARMQFRLLAAAHPDYAPALAWLGVCQAQSGQPDRGWRSLEEATTRAPRCPLAWLLRGTVAQLLRRTDLAVTSHAQAASLRPESPTIAFMHARALVDAANLSGRPEELRAAEQTAERARTLCSESGLAADVAELESALLLIRARLSKTPAAEDEHR